MKTTLEIPDNAVFRRAKARAAQQGIPLRQLITEAVREKLDGGHVESKPLMTLAGRLKHLKNETARINPADRGRVRADRTGDWAVILDTNALSAFAEGLESAVKAVAKDARVAIPVVVLGEYRYGIAQLRRKSEYQRWLDELLLICQVLDIDEATSKVYADVRLELKRAGTPIPVGLSILSRDTHFDAVRGLRRTPW